MTNFNFACINREIVSPLNQFEIRDLLSLDAPTVFSGKLYTMWVKLSNFGNSLKVFILSYSWKTISGWSNYSGIVISQNMNESEMGYRGSKSVIGNNIAVKEQRVDGSWRDINLPCLRCTLMGFERNYQVKIPSSQLFTRQYSTNNITRSEFTVSDVDKSITSCKLNLINPFFITGFTDGERSFMISVRKSS